MANRYPTGKGYFIWQLERCAAGDPERLAGMAAAAGLAWVAIKVHNGIATRNGDISRHVAALAAAGVAVWGWGYDYGALPEKEARLALERVRAFGLAGYIINAEKEYKAPGMSTPALRFVDVLRTEGRGLPVGLCTYRFPSLHPEFPWTVFLPACDFHMPQVYWLEDSRPSAPAEQLARSRAELLSLWNLPFVPLGVSSSNDAGTWEPSVAQLDNFDSAVRAAGLPGVGWWSWQHAEREPTWWAAIAAHDWHRPAPAPTEGAPMKSGTLYGIHAESASQAVPLMRKYQAAGVQVAAVLAMENPGLAVDAKAINPNILTIARWRNPNDRWEGGQDVAHWSQAERLDFARRSIQLIFDRTNDTEYQACDYFCPGLNEWDPPELNGDGYRAMAEVMILLCQEAGNRSPEMEARGLHPIRLAIPGFNAGTPEWNEMQAMAGTQLFGLMQLRGDLLIIHEGVWWDMPIDSGFGDLIPGAPARPAGAGSLCGRFNYLYALGIHVPFVVTEWYDGNRRDTDPAKRLAAMKWYDRIVRGNPWCRGFCPFELTDIVDGPWWLVDFTPTFQSPAMLADMIAEKDKPNPTRSDDMPLISETDFAVLLDTNAKATAVLAKYQAAHVWKAGDVALARALPLTTYVAPGGAVKDVRPNATYDLNVRSVSADQLWLEVAAGMWVKTADVKLKT